MTADIKNLSYILREYGELRIVFIDRLMLDFLGNVTYVVKKLKKILPFILFVGPNVLLSWHGK